MKNCLGCKYCSTDRGGFSRCDITEATIDHPLFMGGPKKCECYEKSSHTSEKFKYPTNKMKEEYYERQNNN